MAAIQRTELSGRCEKAIHHHAGSLSGCHAEDAVLLPEHPEPDYLKSQQQTHFSAHRKLKTCQPHMHVDIHVYNIVGDADD